MAQEIERKFLVASDAWRAHAQSSARLQQGYLSSNAKATVRIRIFDEAHAVLTLKGKAVGLSRAEYEYDVPLGDARELMLLSAPNIVEKRRHKVPYGNHVWEVDVFEGRHEGLVLAEVEMKTEEDSVALPDWLGKEVSDDDRYANASLARAAGTPE